MTISKINDTYQACPICEINYTYIEKQDTKKVVELACTHFFHIQCIGGWFSTNKKDGEDLSCRYCSQVSVEKYNPELYAGEGTLNTLDDQIQYLSRIPHDKWPRQIETSGASVCQETDGGLVRMGVSKNYLERATASHMCDKIQKHEEFKSHIENIKSFYIYDDRVLNAIPHARNLRRDLADFLEEEPPSSVEEIFLLLEDTLKRMDITDDLKEDTRLIMHKFLFDRPALRTLMQEIDRWKKVPVRNWPLFIRVLDEDGSAKTYKSADFKKLVLAAGGTLEHPVEKMIVAGKVVLIGIITLGILGMPFKPIITSGVIRSIFKRP